MTTLPANLTITKARSSKKALLASLSKTELRLVLVAENTDNTIFGGKRDLTITLTNATKKLDSLGRERTKVTESRMREAGGRKVADSLVKRGWMRFVEIENGIGSYVLTHAARNVLRAYHESK